MQENLAFERKHKAIRYGKICDFRQTLYFELLTPFLPLERIPTFKFQCAMQTPLTLFLGIFFWIGCQSNHLKAVKPDSLVTPATLISAEKNTVLPSARSIPPNFALQHRIEGQKPSAGTGLVRITVVDEQSNPIRATISASYGITYSYRMFRWVPAGRYQVEVFAHGYQRTVLEVPILAGQVVNKTVYLKRQR